ncbi:MAG: hypothetical protein D6732_03845 [Methanobacteriota archaeon]|nr:MAG: hypothetical protein D6732_03845 [Euryarchaeota archaeon]
MKGRLTSFIVLLLLLSGLAGSTVFSLPSLPKTIQEVIQENAVEAYYTSKDSMDIAPGVNHTFEFSLSDSSGEILDTFSVSIYIKKDLMGVNILDPVFNWADYITATRDGVDVTSSWNNFTTYLLPSSIKFSNGTEKGTLDFFLSNPDAFGQNVTVSKDEFRGVTIKYYAIEQKDNVTTFVNMELGYRNPTSDRNYPALSAYSREISISSSTESDVLLYLSNYRYEQDMNTGNNEYPDVPSLFEMHNGFSYASLQAGTKFSYDVIEAKGTLPAEFQSFEDLKAGETSIDLSVVKTPGAETLGFDNAEDYFDLSVGGNPVNITETFGTNFSYFVMPVNLDTDAGVVNFFEYYDQTASYSYGGKIYLTIFRDQFNVQFSQLSYVIFETPGGTTTSEIHVLYMADIGVAATIQVARVEDGSITDTLGLRINTNRTTYDLSGYNFTGILPGDDPDANGGPQLPASLSTWFIVPLALIPIIRKRRK